MTLADDEHAADYLPSPRQAMRMAVEYAKRTDGDALDLEQARVWLAIAHELRTGARPKPVDVSVPMPRPFERTAEAFGELPAADQPAAHLSSTDIGRGVPPVAHHVAYEEQGTRCGECGHAIELSLSDLNPGEWIHVMTQQRVCPVSAPDQSHTFATPRVDARG